MGPPQPRPAGRPARARVSGTFTFTFTVSGRAAPVTAPVGSCAGLLEVPVGQVTITEQAAPGYAVTGIRAQPFDRLVSSDLGARSGTFTIAAGGAPNQTIAFFKNRRVTDPGPGTPGSVQICKEAAEPGVGGAFNFSIDGRPGTLTVPVGGCSVPVAVPAGPVVVREAARAGFVLTDVRAEPATRFINGDIGGRAVAVTVVSGETTRAIFRNALERGQLKICKIAGPGIDVGTVFKFVFNGNFLDVPAGPASQGGFCTTSGFFPVGSVLTVTETPLPAGVQVTAISVNPGSGLVGAPDLAAATVSLRIGSQVNEVTFTNSGPGGPTTTTRAPTTTTTVAPTTTTKVHPTTTTTRPKPTTTTTRPKPTTTTTIKPVCDDDDHDDDDGHGKYSSSNDCDDDDDDDDDGKKYGKNNDDGIGHDG